MTEVFCVHPRSGAVRPITTELLSATYLAPRPISTWDVQSLLADTSSGARWSTSCDVAPAGMAAAGESSLRELKVATKLLRVTEVDLLPLDTDARAFSHLAAPTDLCRSAGESLPEDLWMMRHVLKSQAHDANEPLPVLGDQARPLRSAERAEVQT